MRTKEGDWVRLCLNGYPGGFQPSLSAILSQREYQVCEVISDELIRVCGVSCNIDSWVLCADMKEHA